MSFLGFGNPTVGGFSLPSDMSGTLGTAPTGLFSGLDPSASMGASYGSPLGGGLSGQVAGAQQLPGANQMDPQVAALIAALGSQTIKSMNKPWQPITAATSTRSPAQMMAGTGNV